MNRSTPLVAGVALLAITALTSTAAFAAPPATTPDCKGIKAAYPVLGAKCAARSAKVGHTNNTAAKRLKNYGARIKVMEIFRAAILCNDMYGVTKTVRDTFTGEEFGHMQQIAQLHAAMVNAHDPNVPAAAYTWTDLDAVKMTKKQCK